MFKIDGVSATGRLCFHFETTRKKCFIVARSRAAYDDWIASFKPDGRMEYHYVAGHNDFSYDNFVSDRDDIRFLDHWSLNSDYSELFVRRLGNFRAYW